MPSQASAAKWPEPKWVLLKTIVLPTPKLVTQYCVEVLGSPPLEEGITLAGCSLKHGKVSTIVMMEPTSFCDWEVMDTWGHELMHAYGYSHSIDHLFLGGENNWTARKCAFVDHE
jgi:hypothetical protein